MIILQNLVLFEVFVIIYLESFERKRKQNKK